MPLSVFPHAAVYTGYFATLGVLLTFLPPFLERRGLAGAQIGVVMSISSVMVVIAPLAWGYVADRTRRPLLMLRVAIAGATVAMLGLAVAPDFVSLVLAMLAYAAFASSVASQTDAATLIAIRKVGARYGVVRLFGSIGFVLGSAGAGLAMDREVSSTVMFSAMGAGLVLALVSSLLIRDAGDAPAPARLSDIARLASDRRLLVVFVACGLHWVSLAPYHAFFAVHVQDLGLAASVAGVGFAVGAASEVVFMAAAERWRRSPKDILTAAFAVTAVRWVVVAHATDGVALVAIQVLHGFSFGVFYVAAVRAVTECVPERLRATGQGLFFSVVFGIGGGVGTLTTGLGYDRISGSGVFLAAAVVSLLSVVVSRKID